MEDDNSKSLSRIEFDNNQNEYYQIGTDIEVLEVSLNSCDLFSPFQQQSKASILEENGALNTAASGTNINGKTPKEKTPLTAASIPNSASPDGGKSLTPNSKESATSKSKEQLKSDQVVRRQAARRGA